MECRRGAGDELLLGNRPAAAMPNVEDDHFVAFNGEDYTVDMRLSAVEQMPHLKWEIGIFGGHRAALGKDM